MPVPPPADPHDPDDPLRAAATRPRVAAAGRARRSARGLALPAAARLALARLALAPLAIALLALAACGGRDANGEPDGDEEPAADGDAPGVGDRVGVVTGLASPETVLHDPEFDVYYVSNVAGNPSQKDGNGFIARVHPDSLDRPDVEFLRGGSPGITLHAPKGMALVGDTLWVADIDVVRGFNRRTGRPVTTVSLAPLGAVFLNGVARGRGDTLYVTDTGIRFATDGTFARPGPERVFAIARRAPSVAVEGPILSGPNGVAWDSAGARLLVAPLNGPTIIAWTPGGRPPNPRRLAAGPGSFDGLVLLPDRRVLVSSWADSTIYAMHGDTVMTRVLGGVETPAGIGVDLRRDRLLVPHFTGDRVLVYELPGAR